MSQPTIGDAGRLVSILLCPSNGAAIQGGSLSKAACNSGPSRLRIFGGLISGVLALILLTALSACGGKPHTAEVAEPEKKPEAAAPQPGQEQSQIVLLFPSPDDDLLHAERRNVVPIDSAEDRAKQVLEELFRGPQPGLLASVPSGVEVREVFILPNGTIYADLSPDVLKTAGSERELMAVYSIVDTIALNLRGVSRIGILVDGAVHETLSGHVYTGKPLSPDYRYVEESARPVQAGEATRKTGAHAEGDGSKNDGQNEDSSEDEEEVDLPEPPPTDLV